MKENEAKLFLLDQVPLPRQSAIAATLQRGYDAASASVAADPILQERSAIDNRGRIVSWAVDHALRTLIDNGQWNVEYRWRKFHRPTGHFLEIRTGYALLTVSQVSVPEEQPRNVVFRENLRLAKQPDFAFKEFEDERKAAGLPHILLIHGHKQLNFAHLGLPEPRHGDGYIYRTPSILNLPRVVETPHPPTEDTDYEAVMTLKDEIDKWRKDNDAG